MPRIRLLRPALLTLLLLIAACTGGDSPSEASSRSAQGHWEYILPGLADLGPVVKMTLSENSGGQISGTGMILDADAYDAVVQGTRSGTRVDLTVTTSVCTVLFSGMLTDASTLTGTAVTQTARVGRDCRRGAWTLKRQ